MIENITKDLAEIENHPYFEWTDYLSFSLMLTFSALIGIYFGFWGKKDDTTREYLHGGKALNVWPVAASLAVSMVSAVTFLGIPTEVYMYGTFFWLMCVSTIISAVLNDYFYLPVFFGLQLTSSYEYLELRFSKSVRIMASLLYTINTILYMPIVIYIPALVLGQVSGLDLHYITPVISIICIIYTVLGGIKAVVWTDFLQTLIILGSVFTVLIVGVTNVGGFETIWKRNYEGGRIRVFDMNPSPFERTTFWTVTVGLIVQMLSLSTNQPSVQRFISIPTLSKARITLYIFTAGLVLMYSLACFTGLLLYAEYHDCDPMKFKKISKPDQMVAYYVTSISNFVPGLAGLFVAGVVSAALSTLSSHLNSIGATIFEDFICPLLKREISEKSTNDAMKLVIIVFGVVCIALVFVVEKLGLVLQLTSSFLGVTGGTVLAMFTLGMFYPKANSKGVLAGSIVSLFLTGWLVLGAQIAMTEGRLKYPTLHTTAEGCGYPDSPVSSENDDDVFILYKISFTYYSTIGFLLVLIVGIPVSAITARINGGGQQEQPNLFTPVIKRNFIKNSENYSICRTTDIEEFHTKC